MDSIGWRAYDFSRCLSCCLQQYGLLENILLDNTIHLYTYDNIVILTRVGPLM